MWPFRGERNKDEDYWNEVLKPKFKGKVPCGKADCTFFDRSLVEFEYETVSSGVLRSVAIICLTCQHLKRDLDNYYGKTK